MIYLLIAVFLVYYLLLLALLAGWQMALNKNSQSRVKTTRAISVVVAMRNESSNLDQLVATLKAQDYSNFEVFLIDDHSTDDSRQRALDLVKGDPRFRVSESASVGKKAALATGIGMAAGEIIVTTDADCTCQPGWLTSVNGCFWNDDVKLVFGPVNIISGKTLFSQLQSMEFASVLGTGVAAFALGAPLYCNGANLAFRRTIFFEVKGYDDNLDIPSGDDEFLLKKIAAQYPTGIAFLDGPNGIVTTQPQSDLRSFLFQRLRWAGKWRFSANTASVSVALIFAVVQVSVLDMFLTLLSGSFLQLLLYVWSGKALLEFVFLFRVQQHLHEKSRLFPFLVLQLIYPVYFLGIAVSSFFLPYQWKGRSWKKRS